MGASPLPIVTSTTSGEPLEGAQRPATMKVSPESSR